MDIREELMRTAASFQHDGLLRTAKLLIQAAAEIRRLRAS